jgi:hypothetical protein
MASPLTFFRRLFGRDAGPGGSNVLQLFTPNVAASSSPGTKLALAGATMLGLAVSGAVALGALVTLMLALGAIYFLLTQVLGLELDVDPRAFVARAQQYAAQGRN